MKIDNSFFAASRLGTSLITPVEEENENTGFAGGFEKIFADMWQASEELSAESRADRALLMIGQLDDLPGSRVRSEKSGIMFELNLNVRNKVIDAYQEIMRKQI